MRKELRTICSSRLIPFSRGRNCFTACSTAASSLFRNATTIAMHKRYASLIQNLRKDEPFRRRLPETAVETARHYTERARTGVLLRRSAAQEIPSHSRPACGGIVTELSRQKKAWN